MRLCSSSAATECVPIAAHGTSCQQCWSGSAILARSWSNESGRGAPRSLVGRAKGLLSAKTRRRIADLLPWWLRDQLGAREQAANIDWSKTRAFTLPTDLEGCIRINLKGREPQGIVEPGQEYSELCEEIRARLVELTNPANGTPAVRRVWVRNEVFPGERQEQLPDLIVTWNNEAPFKCLASPRFGSIEGDNADPRPGTHSPYGFLLAAGAGVPSGLQGCWPSSGRCPYCDETFGSHFAGWHGRRAFKRVNRRR